MGCRTYTTTDLGLVNTNTLQVLVELLNSQFCFMIFKQ